MATSRNWSARFCNRQKGMTLSESSGSYGETPYTSRTPEGSGLFLPGFRSLADAVVRRIISGCLFFFFLSFIFRDSGFVRNIFLFKRISVYFRACLKSISVNCMTRLCNIYTRFSFIARYTKEDTMQRASWYVCPSSGYAIAG